MIQDEYGFDNPNETRGSVGRGTAKGVIMKSSIVEMRMKLVRPFCDTEEELAVMRMPIRMRTPQQRLIYNKIKRRQFVARRKAEPGGAEALRRYMEEYRRRRREK